MAKELTREQVAGRQEKAVRFVDNVLKDPGRASEIEDESIEDYAARRGIALSNPRRFVTQNRIRRNCMPSNGSTKADLQSQLDDIEEILDSAYEVESSREDLAQAISQALDILQGEEEEEDEDVDDDNGD